MKALFLSLFFTGILLAIIGLSLYGDYFIKDYLWSPRHGKSPAKVPWAILTALAGLCLLVVCFALQFFVKFN